MKTEYKKIVDEVEREKRASLAAEFRAAIEQLIIEDAELTNEHRLSNIRPSFLQHNSMHDAG